MPSDFVAKFITVVEQRQGADTRVPDLARALGLHPKTLRQRCRFYFGVNPHKYLKRYRLSLARRMLERGSTVTAAATEYEFWQLGRFAQEYKKLFGELPSSTRGHHAYHAGSS